MTVDGARYARIENVDRMAPFLVTVVSDSDLWLFAGSNGPFTAGRSDPETGLFPYQTVDKLLHDAATSGARTSLLVTRQGAETTAALWDPNGASAFSLATRYWTASERNWISRR